MQSVNGSASRCPASHREGQSVWAWRRALSFHRRPVETLIERERAHGPAFSLPTPIAGPMWVVATPDLAHDVLHAEAGTYRAGRANRRILPVLPNDTVLTLDGDAHRERRSLLTPLFRGESLAAMAPVVRQIASGEIDRWPMGAPFDVLPRTRFMTLGIAARLLLGVEGRALIGKLERHLSRALHPYTLLAGNARLRHLGPASPQAAARRRRAEFARGIADIRSAQEARPRDGRPDALGALRGADSDGVAIDETTAADEVFALLLAAHETTATALAWAIQLLAFDPDAAAAVAGESGREERPHLDAIVSEVLRHRPPLFDIAREVARPTRLGDRDLPCGTLVLIPPPLLHRHEHVAPDDFVADRFLELRPDQRTWMPFGGGDRRCLGASLALLELREVIACIVGRYELRAAGERPEKARLYGTALPPERGGRVILRRR